MKVCGSCKSPKPLIEFSTSTKALDGRQWACKECCAIDKRFRRYGVTKQWYDQRLSEQEHSCAACGVHTSNYSRSRYFDVDHCHTTGRPRGLLCNRCNMVLGQVDDDPAVLKQIARYIKRFKI
jgi:hypothetical protein